MAGGGRVIAFEIPVAFKPYNSLRRMGFADYRRHRSALADEVSLAARGMAPAEPFECARVTITRVSQHTPDFDGLVGGVKPLVDCLVAFDARSHPNGMGFVADDNVYAVEMVVEARLAPPGAARRTEIVIEELDPSDEAAVERMSRMGATLEHVRAMRARHRRRPPAAGGAAGKAAVRAAGPDRMTAEQYRALAAAAGPARKGSRR